MTVETPDFLHLAIRRPGSPRVEHRHWRIVRPPPSLALALQAQVVRAFGPAYDRVATVLLRALDPQGADALAAEAAGAGPGGEALALDTFRRAATGLALFEAGESLERAAGRLRACATFAAAAAGTRLDAAAVAGELADEQAADGEPVAAGAVEWRRVGLVHRVLYHSQLEWGGSGAKFGDGADARVTEVEALQSSLSQGPVAFAAALDDLVVSADELRLLGAWAVLHLLRPF